MAKKNDVEVKGDQRLETIEETLGKTEQFIVENQRIITIIVGALVLIVLGYFAYNKYYIEPKTTEAHEQMYSAQFYFQIDSIDRALNGDGNNLGFIDIADEYSMTKPGNLANYYAGICLLKTGKYEEAIDYLEAFDAEDIIIRPMAIGATGDAYLELDDKENALAFYLQAADYNKNDFTAPLFYYKAGELCEIMGKYDKALELYEKIKEDYSKSTEARTIEKNIGRVKMLKENK